MAGQTKITSTIAREKDLTIELNFVIPQSIAQKNEDAVSLEFGKNIAVKGFRKGKAPLTKIRAHLDRERIVHEVVNRLMPYAMADAVARHKIKPVIPAQVHILESDFGKDWKIKAFTCELPIVNLGDYKKAVKTALAAKPKNKEEAILKSLLKKIPLTIPHVITDSQINDRLNNLLLRLEKLGLTLEKYLNSLNKKPEEFYKDLQKEVIESISLELILNQIAIDLNLTPDSKEVNKALEAMKADPSFHIHTKDDENRQKRVIAEVLLRRAALSALAGL